MKINIKHSLKVVYYSIALLVILLLGLYIFRNQLLRYVLDSKIKNLESEYQLRIHYDEVCFKGIRRIELNDFSVVPIKRDTLLKMNKMEVKLNILPLVIGNVELNNILVNKLAITFVKRGSVSNYDFLFHKNKKDSALYTKADYEGRVNKLLNLFYNYLPENGTLNNILISKRKDEHLIACAFPYFHVKNNRFNNVIKITEDSDAPQVWRTFGTLDHSTQDMEVTFASVSSGTKILLPYLVRRYGAQVAFSSLTYSMKRIRHFNSVGLEGNAMINGLEIFHKSLSPEKILLNHGELSYHINVGSDYIELDSASIVQFNKLNFHPYIYARKSERKWHFIISVNKPWFPSEELFTSLPAGLFGNLKGIKTSGNLAYHFLLDMDFANLNTLKFHSSLQQGNNFHVLSYGCTNLAKMNHEFSYTAYDNGHPVRTFSIGASWNHYTPLDSISPFLRMAVLQSEDGSFYSHHGFRQETLRNALIYDLKRKRFARGGSTITMQLIKNVFLNRNKNIARKLEEAIIVWLIENKNITSKNRMFEVYLNIAEWGPKVYGIHEASEYYFNKLPSQLSLEESIFLASIIPKPKHFASSFVVDTETGEIKLKSNMQGYYHLIARLLASKGIIDRAKADSIHPCVMLNGKARNSFSFKQDTTKTVLPGSDTNNVINIIPN